MPQGLPQHSGAEAAAACARRSSDGSRARREGRRSGSGSKAPLRPRERLALAGALALCAAYVLLIGGWAGGPAALLPRPLRGRGRGGRDVLVMYVFAATDPEFLENLRFFVREAVAPDAGVAEYVIAVKRGHGLKVSELPELPPHARYVFHENACYDWGTFGWLLLHSGHVDRARYSYFFFINSSVRGPYMPPYARGLLHWAEPFLSRLDATVKLVGPTISCEGSPLDGDQKGAWRANPHVQSYAAATDRVGLQLLIDDRRVFHCHKDRWNTIYFSELGSSAAVLDAGFGLDCLLARYQGVDWRDAANWGCNGRLTATSEFGLDGVSVDPLEVVFVKVKGHMLGGGWSAPDKARKYARWAEEQGQRAANASGPPAAAYNEAASAPGRFRAPRVLEMRARGGKCFDFDHYAAANPDLAALGAKREDLWRHFVYTGQFEAREHRFTCESLDYAQLTAW